MENSGNRLEYLFQLYLSGQMDTEQYAELWKLMQDASGEDATGAIAKFMGSVAGEAPLISEKAWNEKMQRLINATEIFWKMELK